MRKGASQGFFDVDDVILFPLEKQQNGLMEKISGNQMMKSNPPEKELRQPEDPQSHL